MIQLRPDQSELQADVFAAWRRGDRNALAVLPTGGGKSVIVSDTHRIYDDDGRTGLVMAHRRELVGQMSIHLGRQGIRHRIIAPKPIVAAITAEHRREFAGNCYINPSARAAVGSVDTILARLDVLSGWLKQIDLLTCDEGHHALVANKWGAVFQACERAFGLLVTATPQRADRKGLGRHADGVADAMCIGPDMRWLIDHGALCDYEIVCPPTDFDVSRLKEGESGDFTPASMANASEHSPKLVGDVVENYCKYAWGKRAVVFVTDVKTSNKMAAQFNAWGIPAASISANTDDAVRDDMIRRLRDGRLWILVNVDLLGEGFDLPAIEVVIMARPTASLAVYMQQFGRALRTLAGKNFGLVIDHVSNIKRHGFPDRKRFWSLDRGTKRAAREKDPELIDVLICVETGRPYEAIYETACPHCGANHRAQRLADAPGGRGELELVGGDLTRLDAATLARMRLAVENMLDPDKAANRAAYAGLHAGAVAGQRNIAIARRETVARLQDAIAHWAGYQRDVMKRDDSEIHKRFYHAAGMDVISAGTLPAADMDKLSERVLEWIR